MDQIFQNDGMKARKLLEQSQAKGIVSDQLRTHHNSYTCRGPGEYYPTYQDLFERINYYQKNIYLKRSNQFGGYEMREKLKKYQETLDYYKNYGLKIGIFFGGIFYMMPGIRRLPFFARIPASLFVFKLWHDFGKNFGEDQIQQRGRLTVEEYEQFAGIANLWTGF